MQRLRIIDVLGREVSIVGQPKRVVSLVPSDTYSIVALGAEAQLVGRTEYCSDAKHLPTVGGTKSIDVAAVLDLQPDLVIANQEENTRVALEQLAAHTKVYVSMPATVAQAMAHLAKLARLLRREADPQAKKLIARGLELCGAAGPSFQRGPSRPLSSGTGPDDSPLRVARGFDRENQVPEMERTSERSERGPSTITSTITTAFVPIWADPWMTCNGDTYGSDLLQHVGIANAFSDRLRLYPLAADLGKAAAQAVTGRDVRYPRVTLDEVRARNPNVVLWSDEPHVFTPGERQQLATALGHDRGLEVSGKDLFWSGAWTIEAIPRLQKQFANAKFGTDRLPPST